MVRRTKRLEDALESGVARCSKCGETLPISLFNQHNNANGVLTLYSWCKPCKNKKPGARVYLPVPEHVKQLPKKERAAWVARRKRNRLKDQANAHIMGDSCDCCGAALTGARYYWRQLNTGRAVKVCSFLCWSEMIADKKIPKNGMMRELAEGEVVK